LRNATLALSAIISLAACSPQDEADASRNVRGKTVTEAEWRVDAIPQEEPGVARQAWRVANPSARDVLGNLSASLEDGRGNSLTLAFANGITLQMDEVARHGAGTRIGSDGEATFQTVLALPEQVDVRVYRVADQVLARSARQGGPCGKERPTYAALAEFVDDDGDWVLRMAAFRGADAPAERGGEPAHLCGAFAYQQPRR
jgi:hypothetical protein